MTDNGGETRKQPIRVHVYSSELWNAIYVDGKLVEQGSRIPTASWVKLLQTAGISCEQIGISTASPPAGRGAPRLELTAALPNGEWPDNEAELIALVERREKGWELVQKVLEEREEARQAHDSAQQRVKRMFDKFGLGEPPPG